MTVLVRFPFFRRPPPWTFVCSSLFSGRAPHRYAPGRSVIAWPFSGPAPPPRGPSCAPACLLWSSHRLLPFEGRLHRLPTRSCGLVPATSLVAVGPVPDRGQAPLPQLGSTPPQADAPSEPLPSSFFLLVKLHVRKRMEEEDDHIYKFATGLLNLRCLFILTLI